MLFLILLKIMFETQESFPLEVWLLDEPNLYLQLYSDNIKFDESHIGEYEFNWYKDGVLITGERSPYLYLTTSDFHNDGQIKDIIGCISTPFKRVCVEHDYFHSLVINAIGKNVASESSIDIDAIPFN
ncbi:hypothetical protein VCHA48O428_70113 [Vibrio chagasii]|nr:hypothetical protein VCHA48O428_70113 [Vibrio chagasii]